MPKHFYAVIFTRKASTNNDGYQNTAQKMLTLAEKQPGFIAFNSASENNLGIAVSYWKDLKSIENWKQNAEHLQAQKLGKTKFYENYSIQICKVEKSYHLNNPPYHPNPNR